MNDLLFFLFGMSYLWIGGTLLARCDKWLGIGVMNVFRKNYVRYFISFNLWPAVIVLAWFKSAGMQDGRA